MFGYKTAIKKPWSSMRLDQTTARHEEHKCRTQFIRNETISMRHGESTTEFKIYQDYYIGINGIRGEKLPNIPM
jgi:hypothetical protein